MILFGSFLFCFAFFLYCVIKTVSEQASHVMCILLQEATLPENRSKRPWIITMTHKPMYCSNNNPNDCTKTNSMVRLLIILKPVTFSFSCTLRDMGMGAGFFFVCHSFEYSIAYSVYVYLSREKGALVGYCNTLSPFDLFIGSQSSSTQHLRLFLILKW